MTRMERRRRRRRILRIKLATTAAVLALTTASIVALTGGAAETVPEPTPQPPALQAEPVLLTAEHDSTYQPVQMTTEPAQEPEPVEEEDENEKIEAALLEQGYLHEEIPLDFDLQCHLITVCEEYGVPQSVALGVIQAESSFTATAANGSCYAKLLEVDELLRDKNPKPPMDSDLFISRSRKRLADLTPEDCCDAECFEYHGKQIWNGF